MVNRRHFKHPYTPGFKRNNLYDNGQSFHNKNAADDYQEELCFKIIAMPAKAAPKAKDPVSPIKTLAG